MTILTEIRWKCDWEPCGVVSPVIQRREINTLAGPDIGPPSWEHIEINRPDHYHNYHFCCVAHRRLWEQALDKRKAQQ